MATLPFTKMHGAGNDFVMLNNMAGQLNLTPELIREISHRHLGVGADQVLIIEPPQFAENDFKYRIFNADGDEVQQCGNGARCFAQYVFQKGLTAKKEIQVETRGGVIVPKIIDSDSVQVDMGPVSFDPAALPFDAQGLQTRQMGGSIQYCLNDVSGPVDLPWVCVASMGNPHVVLMFEQSEPSDDQVQQWGGAIESHHRFPERVNVGFMTVLNKDRVRLRVYERGVGETLACGTGACAAAAVGMKMGLLSASVQVEKKGGVLMIDWAGTAQAPVYLTGPTQTVFEGEFSL